MKAVAIGSSTGGPKALDAIIKKLSSTFNGIVIVLQHLPLHFTESMVKRMAISSSMPVHHVKHGDNLQKSNIYVVPGDSHFFITSPNYKVFLIRSDGVLQPSIDMGFTSVAEHFGPDSIGVVLTGMGDDGVEGAKAIKQVGGIVITQDKITSVVYGMPSEVDTAGFADHVLPLEEIPTKLVELTDGH